MEWVEFKKKKPKIGTEIIVYYPIYLGLKDFMAMSLYIHQDQVQGAFHWAKKTGATEMKYAILIALFAITFLFLFDHWCRLRTIENLCLNINGKL